MLNIAYASTRDWNVGDNFILKGCENILTEVCGEHNKILYNKSPQLTDFAGNYFNPVVWDNSLILPSDNLEYIDLFVFAGTPECSNERAAKFIRAAAKANKPWIMLGCGLVTIDYDRDIFDLYKTAKLVTCRTISCANELSEFLGEKYPFIVCPVVNATKEVHKQAEKPKVGIVINGSVAVSSSIIEQEIALIEKIKAMLPITTEVELVVHHISELAEFSDKLPSLKINYSYNEEDYINIYNKFDIVIGTRIHGIGLAEAMTIPTVGIELDDRAEALKTFTPFTHTIEDYEGIKKSLDTILAHRNEMSEELLKRNQNILSEYKTLIKERIPELVKK